jgi:thioredoxin-related protein
MKNLSFFIFICLVVPLLGRAQSTSEIEWKSWSELEQSIKEEPKPVFVFFHAKWCSYCKKIEREIFTKPEVIAKLNSKYYAVEMDVEQTDTITFEGRKFINKQALTKRNGVHEIPLLLASRERFPFSLPATIILTKDFTLKKRSFEYYTSKQLLDFLK